MSERAAWFWLLATLVSMFWPLALLADDCGRDISRAQDCMRTNGAAQVLGTAVPLIVNVLVNGASIGRHTFPPRTEAAGGEGGGDDEEPVEYTFDVRTQDSRTDLYADGEDILWVYAAVSCSKQGVDTGSLTQSVDFSVTGPNSQWLRLENPQMKDGFKAVALRAWPPAPDAILQEGKPSVTAAVNIEGRPFSAPVEISVDWFRLEVRPFA